MWLTEAGVSAWCINLDTRPDRWAHMQAQIPAFGFPVSRLSATATPGRGALGCAISHTRALQAGLASGKPWIMVLEDDFQWELHPKDAIDILRAQAPVATILCMSYYIPKAQLHEWEPQRNIVRATEIQSAPGYIIAHAFARDFLLPCFLGAARALEAGQPLSVAALDVMWKPLQLDHEFWITMPRLARQLPCKSDIFTMIQVADYGSNACLVVLPEALAATGGTWPFATLRCDCLETALRSARSTYPLLSHIIVLSEPGPLSPSELFAAWQRIPSPIGRPRSLVGQNGGGGRRQAARLRGNFVVASALVDLYFQQQAAKQPPHDLRLELPALAARAGKLWDQTPFSPSASAPAHTLATKDQTFFPAASSSASAHATAADATHYPDLDAQTAAAGCEISAGQCAGCQHLGRCPACYCLPEPPPYQPPAETEAE